MRRFRTLPLWILAPIFFVFLGGVYFIGGKVSLPDGPLAVSLIGALVFATVMTVFFVVMIARQRRDGGGAAELERIGQAVKTGRVPQDIDLIAWRTTIEKQHQLLRRALWMNPVVLVFMTLVALSLTITQSPYWSLAVAFFAGWLVFSVVTTPRGLRRNAVIREELARREEIAEGSDLRPGEARADASRNDDPAHTPPSP